MRCGSPDAKDQIDDAAKAGKACSSGTFFCSIESLLPKYALGGEMKAPIGSLIARRSDAAHNGDYCRANG